MKPLEYINRLLNETSDTEGKYCRGYCGEFAVALHRVFGYKLGGFYEKEEDDWGITFGMIHVFAYHPKDKSLVIDARGIRP